MSFQSLEFLGFFLLTASICLFLGRTDTSKGGLALLIASAFAYDSHGFLVLLIGLAVTHWVSNNIYTATIQRTFWLWLGVCYHVALLMTFKYLDFFTSGAYSFGWAPVGISFFTFSQIWYLKSVYDGTFTPVSWQKLGLYGLFFPTVVSGPILSPQTFFPHLEADGFLRPTQEQVLAGLYCFGCGLVKKVLLSDQLALLVATGYDDPQALSICATWLVILGFTLQLYLDFSGYCDMATGVALLMGIPLPINFNSPYRATSIGDFWKRWHITLTSFFRHCIYLPLGGNRKGALRTYGHILLIFLISGLWHGAGWTFLLWGLLHGLAQVIQHLAKGRIALPTWVNWCLTFLFVNMAWVLFRAPDLSSVNAIVRSIAGGGTHTVTVNTLAKSIFTTEVSALEVLYPPFALHYATLALVFLFAVSLLVSLWKRNTVSNLATLSPKWYQLLPLGLLVGWCILSFGGTTTFIYANF